VPLLRLPRTSPDAEQVKGYNLLVVSDTLHLQHPLCRFRAGIHYFMEMQLPTPVWYVDARHCPRLPRQYIYYPYSTHRRVRGTMGSSARQPPIFSDPRVALSFLISPNREIPVAHLSNSRA
jgi:hypothetical protein